jgi:hypothetical protein
MKTKASWKPVGHSAKKWKETSPRKGATEVLHEAQPRRKRGANPKSPWK